MSRLITGNIYYGFQVVNEEFIREIDSAVFTMEHLKSGARLLFVQNQDDNKVFSVSFRTPPEDSTGVFHILEHSVLCGSEKYPVKEPFVELLKGSMQTFLNAFTFGDKTMYPVASRNEQDFSNLMEVYLDSVFQPNIYKQKEIFEQEGWHYELQQTEADLIYKGVVYNEMKGSYSSPFTVLMDRIKKSLYPDTIYRHSSGGDPQEIPALTYEQFLKAHSNYYHPSNSYFYLYGDVSIEEKLQFIDQEYLSRYEKNSFDTTIPLQQPTGMTELVADYPILEAETADDKTYLSLNYVIGTSTDRELNLAFDILKSMLMDSNAAPLKQALLESGLGKDAFAFYSDSMVQPLLGITLTHSNASAKDAFVELVKTTLSSLVKNGLDEKLVLAAVNSKEFELREADFSRYPKGLTYNIEVMKSWLYDGQPSTHMLYEEVFTTIREKITDRYFEKLIEVYLLNSDHCSLVVLNPSKTIAADKEASTQRQLSEYKSSQQPDQLEQLVQSTQHLLARQGRADAAEDLQKLPSLSLQDINRSAEPQVPSHEYNLEGLKLIHHDVSTQKIAYCKFYWDTSVVAPEQIPYLVLLAEVLGQMETASYSIEELTSEIGIKTGGIHFKNEIFGAAKDTGASYQPKFTAQVKVMAGHIGESLDLLRELLYTSALDNLTKLQEIVRREASQMESVLNQKGNEIAASRLMSYFSDMGAYQEQQGGVAYYRFIRELAEKIDQQGAEVADTLKDICAVLFNKQNLIISVTGTPDLYEEFAANVAKLDIQDRPVVNKPKITAQGHADNEGFMSSSQVQYVVKGYDFNKLGFTYSGKMQVLKKIMSLTYLWNAVRVKGGAYGGSLMLRRDGILMFTSYRDPNLQETLEVYDQAYRFTEGYEADADEMTKAVIGTLSMLDQPLSPSAQGRRADRYYFEQVTGAELQQERDEILSTTPEDIRQYADLLKAVTEQNYFTVVGNASKLESKKVLFGNLEELVM
ncbi:peptidase M16 [Paenibacillus odorifer]|uniref:Peptidase M16 n=1 Tax=Paenibacillus odorifer TaxID=189426 RepID=A0A1R0WYZ1_9BACL|nr:MULTISPECIES: insulinase family protein [Paenibacillus]ETT57653.1 Zn-dependent peptidase, insulinase family protein [Paenibacillus sp. FSL H8-237]OMD24861.1 peptidase M16 [Paenibacillus odorifer]OME16688.1 peptidase M16 [Paenibacillus odorifer]OME35931.1 peptidase M16 [Paenibacillus odorifer]OME48230.1 peptidase M16 [Paenibacillus odorifer]